MTNASAVIYRYVDNDEGQDEVPIDVEGTVSVTQDAYGTGDSPTEYSVTNVQASVDGKSVKLTPDEMQKAEDILVFHYRRYQESVSTTDDDDLCAVSMGAFNHSDEAINLSYDFGSYVEFLETLSGEQYSLKQRGLLFAWYQKNFPIIDDDRKVAGVDKESKLKKDHTYWLEAAGLNSKAKSRRAAIFRKLKESADNPQDVFAAADCHPDTPVADPGSGEKMEAVGDFRKGVEQLFSKYAELEVELDDGSYTLIDTPETYADFLSDNPKNAWGDVLRSDNGGAVSVLADPTDNGGHVYFIRADLVNGITESNGFPDGIDETKWYVVDIAFTLVGNNRDGYDTWEEAEYAMNNLSGFTSNPDELSVVSGADIWGKISESSTGNWYVWNLDDEEIAGPFSTREEAETCDLPEDVDLDMVWVARKGRNGEPVSTVNVREAIGETKKDIASSFMSESSQDYEALAGVGPAGQFVVDKVLGNEDGVKLVSFREGTSEEGDYAVVLDDNGSVNEGFPLKKLSTVVSTHSSFNDALTKFQNEVARAATKGFDFSFPTLGVQVDDPADLGESIPGPHSGEFDPETADMDSVVFVHEYRNRKAIMKHNKDSGYYVQFLYNGKPHFADISFGDDKEEAQSSAKYWVAGAKMESSYTSPFERAGLKVHLDLEKNQATINIHTQEEMAKFVRVYEEFAWDSGFGPLGVEVNDAEDKMHLYSIKFSMSRPGPEVKPTEKKD